MRSHYGFATHFHVIFSMFTYTCCSYTYSFVIVKYVFDMSLAAPVYPMDLLHKPVREVSTFGLTLETQHGLARYSSKLL